MYLDTVNLKLTEPRQAITEWMNDRECVWVCYWTRNRDTQIIRNSKQIRRSDIRRNSVAAATRIDADATVKNRKTILCTLTKLTGWLSEWGAYAYFQVKLFLKEKRLIVESFFEF